MKQIEERLKKLYPHNHEELLEKVQTIIDRYQSKRENTFVDEKDVMLITYGDSIKRQSQSGLGALNSFLRTKGDDSITAVHLLPMFPFTSDDGFSVVDYKAINPELGDWEDVSDLANSFDLMFDAVINHSSKSCPWFKAFLAGEERYKDHYIVADPELDYSSVTRPRALPLLTPFETSEGTKHIWTTFSEDQVDLNFKSPRVFLDILDVLLTYSERGARFIRLDAIGFAWKELGTTCIHLEETHELIKLYREILDSCLPGTILITETNVPHKENISYFGNGYDEAQMVYQFPLPPLVYYSFITGDTKKLTGWLEDIDTPSDATTYFNFLASHDGIGVRPTEGILTDDERQILVDTTLKQGGRVSYKNNGDGTQSPYELNIAYVDAITGSEEKEDKKVEKFLASQSILLSLAGVPGIYIHSLLGSRNWTEGVEESGINRRINREKLNYDDLMEKLDSETMEQKIFDGYKSLIKIRKEQSAFHPLAKQEVVSRDSRLFSIRRHNEETGDVMDIIINVSNEKVSVEDSSLMGKELISQRDIKQKVDIAPYEVLWIKK